MNRDKYKKQMILSLTDVNPLIDRMCDDFEVQLHELKKGQASKLALTYQQGGAVAKEELAKEKNLHSLTRNRFNEAGGYIERLKKDRDYWKKSYHKQVEDGRDESV